MPCCRCQSWIHGEWIQWRRCLADPFENDWLVVHTSLCSPKDRPLFIHLVIDQPGAHWYFFCRSCRHDLRTQKFRMRLMTMVSHHRIHGAQQEPLFHSSHLPPVSHGETLSSDSSESNPWEGHFEWSTTDKHRRPGSARHWCNKLQCVHSFVVQSLIALRTCLSSKNKQMIIHAELVLPCTHSNSWNSWSVFTELVLVYPFKGIPRKNQAFIIEWFYGTSLGGWTRTLTLCFSYLCVPS